jgi:trehalose/maltose hydrolase-like predicted phosphorylase
VSARRTRARAARATGSSVSLPGVLRRRFEAIVFDWDGTAVPDRQADAGPVRDAVEAACAGGVDVVVVSGTHVDNIDGQLHARPAGPGLLHLCLNRGSEVFAVDASGVRLVGRRVASAEEDAALTEAAELTVERLAKRGLKAKIVSQRLNRRKIDLIPEPAWADPPKAMIGELLAAVEARLADHDLTDLREVVELAEAAAHTAGLAEPRVTSDAKHIEIGLTDKSDSGHWIFAQLWSRGIPAGAVLVAGDEFGRLGGLPGSDSLMLVLEAARATVVSVGAEPEGVPGGIVYIGGGPSTFLSLLEDQVERRRHGEVPRLEPEPGWVLAVQGFDPRLERVHESQLALGDGRLGTRGSLLAEHHASRPAVRVAGLYDGQGAEEHLLVCPLWQRLQLPFERGVIASRRLDLHSGLLHQQLQTGRSSLNALLFSSLARPGTAVLRALGAAALLPSGPALVAPPGRKRSQRGTAAGRPWMSVQGAGGEISAIGSEKRSAYDGKRTNLERVVVYEPSAEPALRRLSEAEQAGWERLLVEQRSAWAARWEDAEVTIEGDPELQLNVRFALFHLMASVDDTGEAAVGARGLSGSAYRGHVFWDSDVFGLPFLAATHPAAARAMLEYRIRRLPAARTAAKELERAGARFPWESAASGVDVTPTHARLRSGEIVPIRTGLLEEHITADVAWAAACYSDWTGDAEFAAGPGRELLVETAGYWASRIRLDSKGRGHIYGVIGPDEYHEPVDDNAYTNVMARWNLRRAAQSDGVRAEERARWLALADALVDGYEPSSGLYEQFAGFFALEPLVIAEVAPTRPIVADALLGRERVQGAQVIKQADVLMLHHLVPGEVVPGSLEPNLRFYEPRTAHGSSLSPGVHAALFARAGRLTEALRWLRLASRIDLDDLTQTTAGGLHLAAMGSVWQALAFGFAGLRPKDGILQLDPRLPEEWSALELRLRFRGSRVRLRIEPTTTSIHADPAISIRIGGSNTVRTVPPDGLRLKQSGRGWRKAPR